MNGILVVDKPAGWTSHDVVLRARQLTREPSIGHIGTLDPMATGVLPLLVGRMTRLAQFYLKAEKSYEGEICLGLETDTYDADGDPIGPRHEACVELEELRRVAASFTGRFEQRPPPFSAKKIRGVPAYKLARKKQVVELKPVEVEVFAFTITGLQKDRAQFQARVAAGTYLRSLAHDLGKKLGIGAHLCNLRRTAVAEFSLADARPFEELEGMAVSVVDPECPITDIMSTARNGFPFLHPRRLLPALPAVTAPADSLSRLLHGNAVNLPEFSRALLVKVFRGQDELIAIARRVAGTLFHPEVVLAAPERSRVLN